MRTTTPELLAERMQLYVQPGERVRQAFLGRGGPRPYAWVVMWLLGPFVPLRIVAVTDRAILLLRASKLSYARPKSLHALVARLPRRTRLGPVRGAWSRILVGPEELWVPQQFYPQIAAADEALGDPPEPDRSPADPRGGGTANVLLPLGLSAAILGAWDASSALGDQERFLGALFALAGLTMLAAGICVLSRTWRDEWGRPLGIIAGAAGIAVGAFFAISQIGFPGARLLGFWIGDGRVFCFGIALMAAAAVAIWRLPRPYEPKTPDATSDDDATTRQEGPSKRAKTVATVLASVGAIATLLFGFVQFWYTNQYLPAKGGAALTATGDLKELQPGDQTGNFRIFALTLTVKNAGTTKIQVLSSLYTLGGVKVARADKTTDDAFYSRAIPKVDDGELPVVHHFASRYSSEESWDLVKFDEILPEGWYFEPAEEFSRRILVSIPEDVARSYEFLRLSIDIVVAKGNRLNPDYYGPVTYPPQLAAAANRSPQRFIIIERQIRPLSQLNWLTRGTHAYASILDLHSLDGPIFNVCIDYAERFKGATDPEQLFALCGSSDDLARKLQEFYGLTWAGGLHDFGLARSRPSAKPPPIVVVDK